MAEPAHHSLHRAQYHSLRDLWTVDHNYGQSKGAGGVQLGLGPLPACVFGNNMRDGMLAHQGLVPSGFKRSTRDNDSGAGQGQICFGFIHQPQEVMMLWGRGKEVEVLFAYGQEHAGRVLGQPCHRSLERGNMGPVVLRRGLPRGSLQSTERNARLRASSHRIAAHLRGKWMCGINHMAHLFAAEIVHQPRHATKPALPLGQRLRHRARGTPGIGKHRPTPGLRIVPMLRKMPGELRSLGGAAQNKDLRHVCIL